MGNRKSVTTTHSIEFLVNGFNERRLLKLTPSILRNIRDGSYLKMMSLTKELEEVLNDFNTSNDDDVDGSFEALKESIDVYLQHINSAYELFVHSRKLFMEVQDGPNREYFRSKSVADLKEEMEETL